MFFIDTAMAAPVGHAAQNAGGYSGIVALVVLLLVGYLFMLRPQMKRQKEHRNLVSSIAVGDEVILSSGIAGKISKTEEQFFQVDIADNTTVRVQRGSVSSVLPKGTLKAI